MHVLNDNAPLCKCSCDAYVNTVHMKMCHHTTATGTQLLLYQLQFGLAAMATLTAPLFRATARRG